MKLLIFVAFVLLLKIHFAFAAELVRSTGGTERTVLRDEMLGLQLVRKGGHIYEGEGVIGRLLTRPGEILTSFIPNFSNLSVPGFGSIPKPVPPSASGQSQGATAAGGSPTSVMSVVSEPSAPSVVRTVILETPAAAGATPSAATPASATPASATASGNDNDTVIIQAVDLPTLLANLFPQGSVSTVTVAPPQRC